jgi:poly(3-hydroxybutyrate) depolymerase
MRALVLALVALLTSCKPVAPSAAAESARAPAPSSRPYGLHVPAHADPARPAPLVVFLHGYGSTGAAHVRMLGLEDFADAHGFVLAYPDGTVDARGKRFWNATDARSDVDDVGYVRWLLDDVASRARIDPRRVYVFGHSNGAFFAHRLACDLAPRIAAAVALAGDVWKDPARCTPSEPVGLPPRPGRASADGMHNCSLAYVRHGFSHASRTRSSLPDEANSRIAASRVTRTASLASAVEMIKRSAGSPWQPRPAAMNAISGVIAARFPETVASAASNQRSGRSPSFKRPSWAKRAISQTEIAGMMTPRPAPAARSMVPRARLESEAPATNFTHTCVSSTSTLLDGPAVSGRQKVVRRVDDRRDAPKRPEAGGR